MNTKATGTFEVTLTPQPAEPSQPQLPLGRRLIDKIFSGDLSGTSHGQMLAVMGGVQGSAGYVAMEVVTGILHGRRGSFALQHFGLMNRGTPSLTVTVVPDSATEALSGLTGSLKINIEGGKHFYEFEYSLGS